MSRTFADVFCYIKKIANAIEAATGLLMFCSLGLMAAHIRPKIVLLGYFFLRNKTFFEKLLLLQYYYYYSSLLI